jgi:hypothetical protein
MTDIAVTTVSQQAEDRSWDLTPPHREMRDPRGLALDPTLFDATTHYPNGYIPSGTIVAIKTTGGKVGPYLDSLSNGQQTAIGVLVHSVQVKKPDGTLKGFIGVAVMVAGMVKKSNLPFTVGTAPLGGYIDAAGQADLPLIFRAADN